MGSTSKFSDTVRQKNFAKSRYPYYPKQIDTRTFLEYKGTTAKLFGTVRQKKFVAKMIPHPLFFLYQKFSETQKGFLTKFFDSVLCYKIFFDNTVMPLPLSYAWKFWTPHFLKHKKVSLRIFSALWDKKFSTDNSDIPFLCKKLSDTRIFLKHWMVPHKTFRHCETNFRQKIVISFYAKSFFNTRSFPIHRIVPTKFFGSLRQNQATANCQLLSVDKRKKFE